MQKDPVRKIYILLVIGLSAACISIILFLQMLAAHVFAVKKSVIMLVLDGIAFLCAFSSIHLLDKIK